MIPAPGILLAAITLLVAAAGLALWRENSWVAAMLAGAGSITLGVWVGVISTRPPGLITDEDEP
jgi:hypothetical protein